MTVIVTARKFWRFVIAVIIWLIGLYAAGVGLAMWATQ